MLVRADIGVLSFEKLPDRHEIFTHSETIELIAMKYPSLVFLIPHTPMSIVKRAIQNSPRCYSLFRFGTAELCAYAIGFDQSIIDTLGSYSLSDLLIHAPEMVKLVHHTHLEDDIQHYLLKNYPEHLREADPGILSKTTLVQLLAN